jgi:protein-S-isoprenylcysteine O-methyltransferase Ste14
MAIALRMVVLFLLLGGVLFGSAGRFDLPFFWAYLAVVAVFLVGFRLTADPRLQQERMGPGSEGRGRWMRLALAPFLLGHFVVAGLDAGRFGWSGGLPVAVQVAGLLGLVAALAWVGWAMIVNRFFSPAVRLQEGEHHVIGTGPYGYVRHPGYVGMVVGIFCSALALGSWWALLPGVGYAALLVWRTGAEDRFLQKELPGYADYARRVRFRLLPGVW